VFDSVNESLGGGSHSHQWTHVLSPGTHTIEIQYLVNQANSTFTIFDRTLSVQLFPV
jgi:hypothetical protein